MTLLLNKQELDSILKIVIQNPYRILGVYANSTKKDIIANKGKAIAFLKVNKSVEYPLDLTTLLSPPIRTIEIINEAESHLAIAKEQIKYAQFWFLKMTPIDEIAFNNLVAGNVSRAIDIWSKHESLSSLQNKLVCYLIMGKPQMALKYAEQLYDKYGDSYISKIDANCTIQMSGTDLLHNFVDSLGEEIGLLEMLEYELGDEIKDYIRNKTIGPLISKISAEVEKTKKVNHKDAQARIEAARTLVTKTRGLLGQLKKILSSDAPQYQIISDKLGLEILQCGIDYFNNSDEEGKHQTAMKMQKYASSIVVGNLAKQRCNENIKILQGIIDKLPPTEVINEQKNILHYIALLGLQSADVDSILKFLEDTCKDLVSIKEKLGKQHTFYLRQATLVAKIALSKSIDALNKVQEEEFPKLNGIERSKAIEIISHAFAASWQTMLWIELIDTDVEFKNNRLKPNKATLKKILDDVDAFSKTTTFAKFIGASYSVFGGCASKVYVDRYMYFTEEEMFAVCNSIYACDKYIAKFPQGKHISIVRAKLEQLKEHFQFVSANTISTLNGYLLKYPNGRYVQEAKKKILVEIEKFSLQIANCKNIRDCVAIKQKLEEYKSDLLNTKFDDQFFILCSSSDDYKQYLEILGASGKNFEKVKKILKHRKKTKIAIWAFVIGIIAVIIGVFVHLGIEESERRNEEIRSMFETAVKSSDTDKCIKFLSTYPHSRYEYRDSVKNVLKRAVETEADTLLLNHYDDLELLERFVKKYTYFSYANVENSVDKVENRRHELATENEKIQHQKADEEMYGTDERAWKTTKSLNTVEAYNEYLKRYPRGRYVNAANKKIIDLEVQQIVNSGNYGELPPSQKMSQETGSTSTIHIRSRCDRDITIMYSGAVSKKIELSPYESRTITIASGRYKIVATAFGVTPFYGTETLTGGDYNAEYYIITTRY